jgi:uncharacterized damage-inducible protein DinB
MASLPPPWLRGPVPGIAAPLQPVAHALIDGVEDVDRVVSDLTDAELWHQPGGAASVGFHLLHVAGSTDRLLSYALGVPLTDAQQAALAAERTLPDPRPGRDELIRSWRETVDRALAQLAATPESSLDDPRPVGRVQLPSSVRGLLGHSAEHAQRHVGQIVTTVKIVRGLGLAAGSS